MVKARLPVLVAVLSLPLLLLTGSALAFVVEQTSQGHDLHWESNPTFLINAAGTPDVTGTGEYTDIADSFAAWQSVPDSSIGFTNGGTTSLDYATVICGAQVCNDGSNIVTWAESGWVGGSGAIGLTYTIFFVDTGEIIEADVTLNGQDYTWTNGDTGVQTDIENITVHEIGHFIGLGHTTESEATMFASAATGETKKRDLHPDDIAGAQFLYGNGPPSGDGDDGTGSPSCCGGAATVLGPIFLIGFVMGGPRKRRRKRFIKGAGIAAAMTLGVLTVSAPVQSATLEVFPLQTLSDYAEMVVQGEVVSVEAVRDPKMGIITVIEVRVDASHKGPAPSTVTFIEQGGEPAGSDIGLRVSGTPQYKVGEEVVVFLEEGRGPFTGFMRTVGLVQGKFRLERTDDGRVFAIRDLAGVNLLRINETGGLEAVAPLDVPEAVLLDELVETIQIQKK